MLCYMAELMTNINNFMTDRFEWFGLLGILVSLVNVASRLARESVIHHNRRTVAPSRSSCLMTLAGEARVQNQANLKIDSAGGRWN